MLEHLSPQTVGLGLALAIGFLVGLEREWADNKLVGLRSFTLIGGTGGMAAVLAETWGSWIIAAALLSVAAVLVVRYLRQPVADRDDLGITTITAALAVCLVGAACVAGYRTQAVVLGGVITLVLHWKQPLHALVDRLGEVEFKAIIRLVLISLVVLPILPNETFGPYDVFNPFQTWLLAVLIVAINLAGYLAFSFLKAESGAVIGGLLGGLVSSTAVTVSFSSLSRRSPELGASVAMIVLLASAVLYGRVGIELAAVSPGLLTHAWAPMATMALLMVATAAALFPKVRKQAVEMPEQSNPARLKVALTFAAMYGVIIVAVAATREHLGQDAIYVIAVISGFTDIDAMTLSAGQLHSRGRLDADVAWRAVFLATLANLLFKIGAASILGGAVLRRYMLTLGTGLLAAGIAILLLWP